MRTLLTKIIVLVAGCTLAWNANAQEGIWQRWTSHDSKLLSDSVTSIGFDQDDHVWLGTYKGVQSFDGASWTDFTDLQHIPSNDIWDIQSVGNTMYFATRTSLTAYDGSTWTSYTTTNSSLVNTPVLCLEDDGMGNLWAGTARGLSKLSAAHEFTSYKHATVPAMPYDGIQDVTGGIKGDVYLSFISTVGLVRFPLGNAAMAQYFKQDSIPNFPRGAVYIMCLAVDHAGALWAGTAKNGVVRITSTGATQFTRSNTPALRNDTITSLAVDECGNVWVATQGGVAMYDGTDWFSFTKSSGQLPNDYVYVVEVDHAGHVWFGTKGGLTEFKPLPKACSLVTPLMNMTMNADSVLCRWDWNCPGITKYWFEIADNPDFVNSVIDTVSPSLTSSASRWNRELANNSTHYWHVKAKNDAGWGPFSPTWVFHVSFPNAVPTQPMLSIPSSLGQNYPNPCSERTAIDFYVATHGRVTLTLFDLLGREYSQPFNAVVGPGSFTIPVDLTGISANGPVFYRLDASGTTVERIMTVVH